MVQRGNRLGFQLEAAEALGIRRELRRQHLHRHLPAQPRVEGAVDLAHPAGGDERRRFRRVRGGCPMRAVPDARARIPPPGARRPSALVVRTRVPAPQRRWRAPRTGRRRPAGLPRSDSTSRRRSQVAGARFVEKGRARRAGPARAPRGTGARPPAQRSAVMPLHRSRVTWPRPSSRASQSFAIRQSRVTVCSETLRTSAVSSTLRPPK